MQTTALVTMAIIWFSVLTHIAKAQVSVSLNGLALYQKLLKFDFTNVAYYTGAMCPSTMGPSAKHTATIGQF